MELQLHALIVGERFARGLAVTERGSLCSQELGALTPDSPPKSSRATSAPQQASVEIVRA